jgi:hypothetical protein
VEGCTHHLQSDDIGTVKIPRWIRQMAGDDIRFEWTRGACYPRDISEYAVIVHCGGCMLNRREMQYRVEKAREQGVYITNYGMLIAYVMGILPRSLKPFPTRALPWRRTVWHKAVISYNKGLIVERGLKSPLSGFVDIVQLISTFNSLIFFYFNLNILW